MTLKSPWHSTNLAPVLWRLEPGCEQAQGAAAWAGVPGSGPRAPAWMHSVVPQPWLKHGEPEAACLWWHSLIIRAGGPFSLEDCSPSLPRVLCGHRGLEVALPTRLVEAGSGGSWGQGWPSPSPGLDRSWRGQRNARLWQIPFIKVRPAVSALCLYISNKESTCMQRGVLVRMRFKSHLSSAFVVSGELIQKQVASCFWDKFCCLVLLSDNKTFSGPVYFCSREKF